MRTASTGRHQAATPDVRLRPILDSVAAEIGRFGGEFLLHIGRQKSGTSALQRALASGRAHLARHETLYPGAGGTEIAHHRLARFFRATRDGEVDDAEQRLAELRRLTTEIAGARARRVLISSEGLQNTDPRDVAAVFPPDRTRIVVYLREQLDFAVSAYCQAIQAQARSTKLHRFVRHTRADYAAFLGHWSDAFGQDRLIVRVYDRASLRDGDVVADFFHEALGIAPPTYRAAGSNPSIGGLVLALKHLINATLDPAVAANTGTYRLFAALAASDPAYRRKPRIPAWLAEEVRDRFARSNVDVANRYLGRDTLFEISQMPPPEPLDTSREAVLRLFEALQADPRGEAMTVALARHADADLPPRAAAINLLTRHITENPWLVD